MTERKVLIIGWDGADWKVASPLIDAGKMPNLARLIENGVMGNISTLFPVLSPMLWTSIATGKRAHKHGIHGFAEPDPQTGAVRPITNLSRKCKTVWNILNQHGKKCNVVGWWPSHPAEPLNGVMVSNHFQNATVTKDGNWPMRAGTIHPASLTKQLGKFRVHPMELQAEQLLPFVPDAAKVDQEKDQRIVAVAKTLAETSSVHAVATAIMQHEPWDFMGVYYDGIDHFSHGFMKYHPPRESWIPEEDFELYKNVIETAYRFHDIMLGTLLQLAGPETTVILLSDHGFHPDHLRPKMISNEPAGPADEHRQFGMLVLSGPGIKKDDLVFGASLLDITPTILALYGLPVGRDMDGKPLTDIFEPETEVEFIDSWEDVAGDDGRHPPDVSVDAVDAHESLKQLVELGYVEQPDEDMAVTVRNTIRELRYNLARDLFDSNQLPRAITELSRLWEEFPDESRFGVNLFNCYLRTGDTDNAEKAFSRLVSAKQRYAVEAQKELAEFKEKFADTKPEDMKKEDLQKIRKVRRRSMTNPHAFAFLRGSLLHAKGEFEEALKVLKKAEGVQTYNLPSLRQKIGESYIGLEDWDNAKQQYELMLEMDAANAVAHLGIARCELAEARPKKAFAAARSSIGLVYHNPQAHFVSARALLRLGRNEAAVKSMQTALEQNRVFPDCHRLLAAVFRKQGDVENALAHEELAEAAASRIANFKQTAPLPDDIDLQLDVAMDQAAGIDEIGNVDETFSAEETVVVVSGLPRSGTSMMMQVLAAGGLPVLTDAAREADASNPRGYFEYEPVKKLARDNSWVKDARGKAVKIIAQLLPRLPRDLKYRVIFMARPLSEIVSSQKKMLSRLDRKGAALSDRHLAATFKRQVDSVAGVLARCEDLVAITVNFSDSIADPVQTASRINRLLGGNLDESAMARAIDPTLRNEVVAVAQTDAESGDLSG